MGCHYQQDPCQVKPTDNGIEKKRTYALSSKRLEHIIISSILIVVKEPMKISSIQSTPNKDIEDTHTYIEPFS